MAFHDFSPKTAAVHRRLNVMLLHRPLQAFVDAAPGRVRGSEGQGSRMSQKL
jgi:hypothetical protein